MKRAQSRKTETTKVVAARGVTPIVKVAWPRQAFWLYGVVEPLSGWHFEQEYSKLNSENFQQFVDALSEQLGTSVAVMQLDRAPAHRAQAIDWPENIIPLWRACSLPRGQPD